uniref:Secreted protein n=1 Tax=Chromera velia CCMP2878 TaxID=1169474 RepID=A0A0G4HYZ7_9ALVE|eukprot:Cvel_33776.t1-p1 / transcript=Cvel_33776.t1 / gene=Cvel_33776 / organism=Chromera_velia_CCMP2878 / gene_product=hypothetical protein / transcript_product=hypothetical protein / location=Cvel_scaffold5590:1929-2201(-) / protein_length=91 / sequence_SO=supercontig / SO=protein_coding / is_pseudo=false
MTSRMVSGCRLSALILMLCLPEEDAVVEGSSESQWRGIHMGGRGFDGFAYHPSTLQNLTPPPLGFEAIPPPFDPPRADLRGDIIVYRCICT